MDKNAVPQRTKVHGGTPLALSLLAAAAFLLAGLSEAAEAALVGKDGMVHACYRAKGKHKGAVRLVSVKGKCRHGERKLKWSVAGPQGLPGSTGEGGAGGSPGSTGSPGTSSTTTLEKSVSILTTKVEGLEATLKGVTNQSLTGGLAKLQGVSGTQLEEAVASTAAVDSLCTQVGTLTGRANELSQAIAGINITTLLAVVLHVPPPPTELDPYTCT
jgi:hypothetical protein